MIRFKFEELEQREKIKQRILDGSARQTPTKLRAEFAHGTGDFGSWVLNGRGLQCCVAASKVSDSVHTQQKGGGVCVTMQSPSALCDRVHGCGWDEIKGMYSK